MADDRIYMQCNICGEKLYLGKQFAWGPFYWENYGKLNGDENSPPLEDELNKFFVEHHHPESDSEKWNGNFSIVYEIDSGSNDYNALWEPVFPNLVRCRDCKYALDDDIDTTRFWCSYKWPAFMVPGDGYCFRGEDK